MKRSTWILAVAGAGLLAGCGEDDDDDYYYYGPNDTVVIDDDLADDAMDAAMVDQSQVAMDYAMTDPLYDEFYYDDVYLYQHVTATSPTPVTPELLAAQVASSVSAYFVPPSCAAASSEGSTATVVFDGCDTALAALDITGTATVTFAQAEGAFAAHFAATDLAINGGMLDWDADATGSRSDDQRTLTVTSTSTWTGPSGTIERELGATLRWTQGSGCVLADGSGSSELDGTVLQGVLSGYRHCANECPAAGTLTWSAGSSDLTLTFDGTSSPELVSSDGAEREFDLTCEE